MAKSKKELLPQVKPDERMPFLLPLKDKDNIRMRTLRLYSSQVWRITKLEDIEPILNQLYEFAYGNGLSDMDVMHALTNKTLSQQKQI
jgi:hypothetical protein